MPGTRALERRLGKLEERVTGDLQIVVEDPQVLVDRGALGGRGQLVDAGERRRLGRPRDATGRADGGGAPWREDRPQQTREQLEPGS
jgi:hypothetical protein